MKDSGLRVEIIIHKTAGNRGPIDGYQDALKEYIISDLEDKMIVSVPTDWIGFRNGTVTELRQEFGKDIFLALAYFSHDANEEVFDFEGKSIDPLQAIENNIPGKKYVKKRLLVVEKVNKDTHYMIIKAYVLNIKYAEPVLKVLEVSCVGEEGAMLFSQLGKWVGELKIW